MNPLQRFSDPRDRCRAAGTAWGLAVLLISAVGLSGCSANGLPPVFGAVFGLEGANVAPFTVGTVPEPMPAASDRILGLAANSPGQCIYLRSDNRRFRATCPEGYRL